MQKFIDYFYAAYVLWRHRKDVQGIGRLTIEKGKRDGKWVCRDDFGTGGCPDDTPEKALKGYLYSQAMRDMRIKAAFEKQYTRVI